MSTQTSSRPIFQLRKELSESCAADVTDSNYTADISTEKSTSLEKPSTTATFNNANKILTENEVYTVSRLTSELPSSLKRDNDESQQTIGFIDTSLRKALMCDRDNIFIWNYDSRQRDTPSIRIPLHDEVESSLSESPACLITTPLAAYESTTGNSEDDNRRMEINTSAGNCGVIIFEKQTGRITYYEDVESINNLYPQLSKAMSHSLDLNLAQNERITKVLNLEPAGIIVATSLGAVHFITIRDNIGKPRITLKQTLIKAHRGLLSQFFRGSQQEATTDNSHAIVSLKQGPVMGKGERLLYITTKCGDFQVWQLGVSSKTFRRINVNVFNKILESLQDLYPFAYGSLKLIDSHPLLSDSMNVQLFLSTITDNNNMFYIISTIILDEKFGAYSIFSTYRLNTMNLPTPSEQNTPRLLIPSSLEQNNKSIASVFVLFQNCLVITQISSKLDSSFTLKRKWEDIISFNEDINVIGYGYSMNSLYIISKEVGGIMRVELKDSDDTTTTQDLEETRFVKSHVEQATYFSNASLNNPIEFNLPPGLSIDREVIEHDLLLCNDGIFGSTSKFIPNASSNLEQHLNSRINYYKNFLRFIELNFNNNISPNLKLQLIENFETVNCALRFLQCLDKKDNVSARLNTIWLSVLSKNNIQLEDLIVKQLDKFPLIFIEFLKSVDFDTESNQFKCKLINLLISCFYEAILEDGERTVRYDMFKLDPLEVNDEKLPWYINYEILNFVNNLFFNYKFSIKAEAPTDTVKKEQFLTLLKILYYFFNQIKLWRTQAEREIDQTNLDLVAKLYDNNHTAWNDVLCELNYKEQSIRITDFYQDFESLVQTLETLDGQDSLYEQFFEKFDYDFASTLFSYYITNNKLSKLFYRFPEQHHQLVRFFEENIDKYRNISWIQNIMDDDYSKASMDLVKLNLLGNSIVKNQTYLNIAKLSGLVDETNIDVDALNEIQSRLDLIDGEIDLKNKLKQHAIEINSRYEKTPFKKIYDETSEKLQKGITIPFNQVIEQYSLLNDAESFFCALKLIAFNSNSIEYEIKKFLIATLWRRCILSDKFITEYDTSKQLSDSMVYQVLEGFFGQELFLSDIALPSVNAVTDRYIVTEEYLTNTYGEFTSNENDISQIRNCIEQDIQEVSEIAQLGVHLHTIINAANESTGNQCVVNYETNTIEPN
ncbi:similar to Saccharomyces cerevisiae YKR082W NUP133 Subunit of the Nup84p subcomplex of the nuclear pore complex (NPC) [Maudiozyma saulgeensis]|uniref:Similar to Saccharomyces cerevisiae YKR082W NUP133 Subunit of the Nup84p subcomplex of the nuclear pore complex (NPC) n=1 Tax=Maudiozyma saulgeensis TaxID=1789683 RepID=A0A1X7R9Z6_9SACH|nr:similar to Saccharomyces cerevisiae YKR082W NUP133 Subunit of the Nup84p subcomplex of the nuclear pore complex (NPC) [Kazachstania saulgeensis]